jgi:hypothetical protein
MRISLSEDFLEIRLARWQKVLGLMRDIRIARTAIADVEIVADPIHEVLHTGLKVGLRLPWLYYVARTIRLDEAWLIRRGAPALSFAVQDGGVLRRVTVSTSEAEELARKLGAGDASSGGAA